MLSFLENNKKLCMSMYLYIYRYNNIIFIKEGPVCWYDGLSCKLNSIAIKGSIPFLPINVSL